MLGRLIRMLFALTGIKPLSVSLAYLYPARDANVEYAVIGGLRTDLAPNLLSS